MPNNKNPQCKEIATLIDKQLQNNAAIAKRVEMLKSQLENKYKDNKYNKSAHLKRQVSLHEDIQNSKPSKLVTARSSPAYHRSAKSVSYVTRPTYDLKGSHEAILPLSLRSMEDPEGHAGRSVGFDPVVSVAPAAATPSSFSSSLLDPDDHDDLEDLHYGDGDGDDDADGHGGDHDDEPSDPSDLDLEHEDPGHDDDLDHHSLPPSRPPPNPPTSSS